MRARESWKLVEAIDLADEQGRQQALEEACLAYIEFRKQEGTYSRISRGTNSLWHAYINQGRYRDAMQLNEQLIDKYYDECDGGQGFDLYRGLAVAQHAWGDYQGARASLKSAIVANAKPDPGPLHIINSKGGFRSYIYDDRASLALDEDDYNQAYRIHCYRVRDFKAEGMGRPDHLGLAMVNRAWVLYFAGDYDKIVGSLDGKPPTLVDNFMWPETYIRLALLEAMLKKRAGDRKGAQTCLSEIIRTYVTPEVDQFYLLKTEMVNRLATMALLNGDLATAGDNYKRTLQIMHRTETPGHPLAATATLGLGTLTAIQGGLTSATAQCEAALAILDHSVLPDHPRIMPTLVALAALDTLTSQSTTRIEKRFARLDACRKKPTGTWREDAEDMLALYTPLLLAHDHAATAERLKGYLPPPPKLTIDDSETEVGLQPQLIN